MENSGSDCSCGFALRRLPYCFRVGIAVLVVTLLGGYIVSGLFMRMHYDNRDEVKGLSMNDIIGAYHGVQTPSPLIAALETGHPESLVASERTALLTWLRGDRVSMDYDNLDLGEDAPSEIIAMNCLECHTRSSTGENAKADVPLEYWDDIRVLANSKDIQPAGKNIVAMSQHAHAPSMAIILMVLGVVCAWTRFNKTLVGFFVFVGAVGLLVDMAGWWITREVAWFAYAIVVGGGLYAAATSVVGLLILVDCLLPAGKAKAG